MVTPVGLSQGIYPAHRPDDPPPTPAEKTDAAIAKYELLLKNGASASDLDAAREAVQRAVADELESAISGLPQSKKTDREPLQNIIDRLGQQILERHSDLPAGTKEVIEGAIGTYKTEATTWAPEDRGKVDQYIKDALDRNNGDIQKAFEYLRDKRWHPSNYYDTNLAIAADYLRARWEVQKYGLTVPTLMVDTYLDKKKNNEIPQNGPGPVSPYSELQKEYMHKGIDDQWNTLNWFQKLFADQDVEAKLIAAALENDLS